MKLKKLYTLLILSIVSCNLVFSQTVSDTLKYNIYFKVGKAEIVNDYKNNGATLHKMVANIQEHLNNSTIDKIKLRSGASPEGNTTFNQKLSNARCNVIKTYLQNQLHLPDSMFVTNSVGEDWVGLVYLIEESTMPNKEQVLNIIKTVPEWVTKNSTVIDSRKKQLMDLNGGSTWNYMLNNFFGQLRNSSAIELIFKKPEVVKAAVLTPAVEKDTTKPVVFVTPSTDTVIVEQQIIELAPTKNTKPFYMGVRTNMLYDLALVPNIGVEFYLGKGWTIGGNWAYAWWSNNSKHYYWRIYGGELYTRKYFGKVAQSKPLTGHHLGAYGQFFTYDFELGKNGYMGGKPNGTLWEQGVWGVGLEYGYTLPIAKRLNLDFSLGLGYLNNKYNNYHPVTQDNNIYYIYDNTKQQHYFGPTKVEIALVWLLGKGNVNKCKK